jgi:bifunctional DNase/RNase
MRQLDVVGVRVEMPSSTPIVLLRELEGDRYLPIWIGSSEASAIAFAQQGVVPARPLTHDLLRDVLEAMGRRLDQVHITGLREGTYYAVLVLDDGTTIDARPSDAIAVALRAGASIYAMDDVLEEAGVLVPADEDDAADQVAAFREFLDQVSPEDFGADGPPA